MTNQSKKKTPDKPKKTELDAHITHTKTFKNKAAAIKAIIKKIPKYSAASPVPNWLLNIQKSLFFLVSILFLLFAGFFLFEKIFKSQSIARFLPANDTAVFLEVNIDKNSQQVRNFFKTMEGHVPYRQSYLIEMVNNLFSINYSRDLEPWLGRKLGLALVKIPGQTIQPQLALFVEMKKIDKAISFLKSRVFASTSDELVSESYKGFSLYSYKTGQNFHAALLNNYAVFSENDALLKHIVDTYLKPNYQLKTDSIYKKIINNLPPNPLGFLFVNNNRLFNMILTDPRFQSQKIKDLMALQPFLKIFQAEGFVFLANGKGLTIQSFTDINKNELNSPGYLTFSDKYRSRLLSLTGENPVFLAGGHDLYKELQRIQEIFQAGTKTSSLIFGGLLEAQKQKYFGKDISLQDDIYALLKNEYLFAVDNNFEKPIISIFLELSDKTADIGRFEKIVEAFIKTGAIFSPRIQQITLSDGTRGEEIVANTEEITRSSQNYANIAISTLSLGNLGLNINYVFLNNDLIISTQLETIKNIIDRTAENVSAGGDKSLKNFTKTTYFLTQLKPLLQSADEFFHIKIGAVVDILGLNQHDAVKTFLTPFTNLSITKNYFNDGISTVYLIDIL